MPSKLDQHILDVALAYAHTGPVGLQDTARLRINQLTAKDIAKLPDRASPTISANKAGYQDAGLPWEHVWFIAITELLAQHADGRPGLWRLAERDTFTYPEYAIVRLLRLLVDGAAPVDDADRLSQLFATQHPVRSVLTIRAVVADPDERLLPRLRTYGAVVLPNYDDETLGERITHIVNGG